VLDFRVVGEKHLKLRLETIDNQAARSVDAIAFFQAGHESVTEQATIRMVYKLSVNDYNGSRNMQLMVEHIQ